MKSWVPPKLRVLLFVTIANVLVIGSAALTLDRAGWFWFAPIALSINILLATYDLVLDFARLRGELVRGHDAWGLLKLVHDASAALEIKPPAVYVIDRASAQALSYSRWGSRARLVITTGALDLLSPAERAAVVTHQATAIRLGFSVINYWSAATADLVHRAGRAFERVIAFVFGWTPNLATWIIRPVTWTLNTLLLGPGDFARLDREAARHLEDPETLARALYKLDAYAQTRPWTDPWTFANMCLVSPIPAGHVWQVLRVQPPVAARIEQLAGRFPI